MKAILWIIAGVGVGLAAYVVLNQPGLQYASGNDGVEMRLTKRRSGAQSNVFRELGRVLSGS
jgi:hypothetical protein